MSPGKTAAGAESAKIDEKELRAQLEKRPGNARVNYQMMKLMIDKDRKDSALVHGLRAIGKHSNQATIYAEVLKLLNDLKLNHIAVLVGKDAAANGVSNPRVIAAVARAQAAAQDVDAAVSTLDSADKAHPDNRVLKLTRTRIERLKRPRAPKKGAA